MNLGAGQPASLPYGVEPQRWYSYHSMQFSSPLHQSPFSSVCYHPPPQGNYPPPNHYPPPHYFVSPNPYPPPLHFAQPNSYPPPPTPNPYFACAYQPHFIPTNQFVPPPHNTHEPPPNPQLCSVPPQLDRVRDLEVPIVDSSHSSFQFSDARLDEFIESVSRLFDNCISKCMKGIRVSEGSSPSVPTQTTKLQSSKPRVCSPLRLQPVTKSSSQLGDAQSLSVSGPHIKQACGEAISAIGGVKKRRHWKRNKLLMRNKSLLKSSIVPSLLNNTVLAQSNNTSASFCFVSGIGITVPNFNFVDNGCDAIDFVFGDKLTGIDVACDNEKRKSSDMKVRMQNRDEKEFSKLECDSVNEVEHGPNLYVKGRDLCALHLLDEMSNSNGRCSVGRTVAAVTSIRDKGGGLALMPLEFIAGFNHEEGFAKSIDYVESERSLSHKLCIENLDVVRNKFIYGPGSPSSLSFSESSNKNSFSVEGVMGSFACVGDTGSLDIKRATVEMSAYCVLDNENGSSIEEMYEFGEIEPGTTGPAAITQVSFDQIDERPKSEDMRDYEVDSSEKEHSNGFQGKENDVEFEQLKANSFNCGSERSWSTNKVHDKGNFAFGNKGKEGYSLTNFMLPKCQGEVKLSGTYSGDCESNSDSLNDKLKSNFSSKCNTEHVSGTESYMADITSGNSISTQFTFQAGLGTCCEALDVIHVHVEAFYQLPDKKISGIITNNLECKPFLEFEDLNSQEATKRVSEHDDIFIMGCSRPPDDFRLHDHICKFHMILLETLIAFYVCYIDKHPTLVIVEKEPFVKSEMVLKNTGEKMELQVPCVRLKQTTTNIVHIISYVLNCDKTVWALCTEVIVDAAGKNLWGKEKPCYEIFVIMTSHNEMHNPGVGYLDVIPSIREYMSDIIDSWLDGTFGANSFLPDSKWGGIVIKGGSVDSRALFRPQAYSLDLKLNFQQGFSYFGIDHVTIKKGLSFSSEMHFLSLIIAVFSICIEAIEKLYSCDRRFQIQRLEQLLMMMRYETLISTSQIYTSRNDPIVGCLLLNFSMWLQWFSQIKIHNEATYAAFLCVLAVNWRRVQGYHIILGIAAMNLCLLYVFTAHSRSTGSLFLAIKHHSAWLHIVFLVATLLLDEMERVMNLMIMLGSGCIRNNEFGHHCRKYGLFDDYFQAFVCSMLDKCKGIGSSYICLQGVKMLFAMILIALEPDQFYDGDADYIAERVSLPNQLHLSLLGDTCYALEEGGWYKAIVAVLVMNLIFELEKKLQCVALILKVKLEDKFLFKGEGML